MPDPKPQHRSTPPASAPPPTPPNSRSDSQICTASHISVVIFVVLPLLRMRPKETFSCTWTFVCVCVWVRKLLFPLLAPWHTGPGSSISAGNVTAAATTTNNFDIALQSCGANIAEHWALRVLRTGCARILWNQRNGGALTCMLRKRATGNTESGQLGHKTRLHKCDSNARLKYTLPSANIVCNILPLLFINLLHDKRKRISMSALVVSIFLLICWTVNGTYRARGIDIDQACKFKYVSVHTP